MHEHSLLGNNQFIFKKLDINIMPVEPPNLVSLAY
jgi:hypothetical protein